MGTSRYKSTHRLAPGNAQIYTGLYTSRTHTHIRSTFGGILLAFTATVSCGSLFYLRWLLHLDAAPMKRSVSAVTRNIESNVKRRGNTCQSDVVRAWRAPWSDGKAGPRPPWCKRLFTLTYYDPWIGGNLDSAAASSGPLKNLALRNKRSPSFCCDNIICWTYKEGRRDRPRTKQNTVLK